MGQGLPAIVAMVRGFVDLILIVDQVPRLTVVTAARREIREGSATRADVVVAETQVTITTRYTLRERHVGHVRPGLQCEYCLGFLLSAELAEIPQSRVVIGRRGGHETEAQLNLAVTVLVVPGHVFAQDRIGRLVGSERRFPVDQFRAATIIQMAEGIDLAVGRTDLARGAHHFFFCFCL
ncbi:hypothetical protein D3C78_728030 [compost metagenome]